MKPEKSFFLFFSYKVIQNTRGKGNVPESSHKQTKFPSGTDVSGLKLRSWTQRINKKNGKPYAASAESA